ncbi:hypothetical protein IFM47457_00003 [Aspergillus lentulus]|nr:hypothetical protein IFM47457_00003 [Aspergillus lentulus]
MRMRTIAPLSVRGDGAPDSWFVFGNGQAEGERKTLNVTQIPLGGCIHSLYDNTACYPEHQRLGGYDMTPSVPSSYRRVTLQLPLIPEEEGDPNFSIISVFLGKMSNASARTSKIEASDAGDGWY